VIRDTERSRFCRWKKYKKKRKWKTISWDNQWSDIWHEDKTNGSRWLSLTAKPVKHGPHGMYMV